MLRRLSGCTGTDVRSGGSGKTREVATASRESMCCGHGDGGLGSDSDTVSRHRGRGRRETGKRYGIG